VTVGLLVGAGSVWAQITWLGPTSVNSAPSVVGGAGSLSGPGITTIVDGPDESTSGFKLTAVRGGRQRVGKGLDGATDGADGPGIGLAGLVGGGADSERLAAEDVRMPRGTPPELEPTSTVRPGRR
jgi:hypothetical protein